MNKEVLEGNKVEIMKAYGRIDVLLNAAGGNMPGATIAPDKTFFDLEIDAFKKVVDLNLFGTVLPTMVFAGIMVDQKKGSIVNFCSESDDAAFFQHRQLLFRICTPSVDSCGRLRNSQSCNSQFHQIHGRRTGS